MARFIMILVIGAIITYAYTSLTLNQYTSQGTKNTVDNFSYNRSHDIANGMTDIILMRVADDLAYRVTQPNSEVLFDGQVTYKAENACLDGDSLIKITVAANFNGVTKTITTYSEKAMGGWVPPVVRGAWTANGDLNNTISDMFIDGRDHDLNLNIIPNTGRFGISSSTAFTNVDEAAIGGTRDSIDYPMSFPENPAVIEEFYDWGGSFPQTPDEILDYPEGTLKAAAQSGQYGSQYLLNPDDISKDLSFPVSGVTYIEITDGDERELDFEEGGNKGIFIVHGPGQSSRLKKITIDDKFDGRFTGLLITDYSFHHHLNILGTVIQLSPNLETDHNCNGNKDHWVYYSSGVIEEATEIAAEISGLSGGKVGYGFGKKRVGVRQVYE